MSDENSFEAAGAGRKRKGVIAELMAFLAHNKKWWLLPIIIMILALGGIIVLGGSAAAPFIYTLF